MRDKIDKFQGRRFNFKSVKKPDSIPRKRIPESVKNRILHFKNNGMKSQ